MNFTIGFDRQDEKKLQGYWSEILENQKWSDGKFTNLFEEKWSKYVGAGSVAFSSWWTAAMCMIEYYNIKNKTVLVPSNTFMATPLACIKNNNTIKFIDCNTEDLCMSYKDLVTRIDNDTMAEFEKIKMLFLVHIGGHIAFDIKKIVQWCKERNIILVEDCAHAHGASYDGKKAGTFGDCGIYSFYATKTLSTGEGGMLVSKDNNLIEFARSFRDYGKPEYKIKGINGRMSEFQAAIGCVNTDRLDDIVIWKNDYAINNLDPIYRSTKLNLPSGMISGLYKYITFSPVTPKSTGKVYDEPCHRILKTNDNLPNTDWVSKNHWCAPLYYKGE